MIKNRFGRAVTMVGSLALLAAASGCSSGPDIRSAYDDGSDFSQYKSYNFYADAGQRTPRIKACFHNPW